ncbi:MAG: O-antigen ligase family protein [Cyclobacteriaceae bacterium]|nr:O-antigen ligase family protein [Cyclobacteriaceae bacterium]
MDLMGIRRKYWSDFKLICLAAILLVLPYSYRVSSIVMAILLLYTLYQIIVKNEPIEFLTRFSFWAPASFIVISLIGLSYSLNLKDGLGAIERQLPLLVFPAILSQSGISRGQFKTLQKVYVVSLVLMMAILEIRTIWLLSHSKEHGFLTYFFSYYHTYENLTTTYLAQPVYIGAYIVLSNMFCITIIKEKSSNGWWFYLFALLFGSFFLFQLAARSSIILNFILIPLYIVYLFYLKKKLILGSVLAMGILTASVILFSTSGFSKLRMQWIVKEFQSGNIYQVDPQSRLIIWPIALDIIVDNWILGVGTGDAEDALISSYKSRGLQALFENKLNAHNQYLTTIMRHGILGIIVLLLNFSIPLIIYSKSHNPEAFLFTLLIMGFFLTENVLGRAQGVIFFSLFHSVYLTTSFGKLTHENSSIWNKLQSRINRYR